MSQNPTPSPEPGQHADGWQALRTLVVLGQLDAFETIVADARLAPDLATRSQLTRLGLLQFAPVDRLLETIGDDASAEGFSKALESFHSYTPVATWPHALAKIVVTSGMVTDVLALIADEESIPDLDLHAVAVAHEEVGRWAHDRLAELVADDRELAGRVAMLTRRMIGEASAQAQRVATREAGLMALLTGEDSGSSAEIEATSQLIGRLVELSARRLEGLGLQP